MSPIISTMQGLGFYFLMLRSCSDLNIGTNEQIKIAPFFNRTVINLYFLQWFSFVFCFLLVSVWPADASVPFSVKLVLPPPWKPDGLLAFSNCRAVLVVAWIFS